MERKFKPLRPALATTTAEHDSHVGNEDPVPGIKRKRVQVKVACDTCRTKKSACDGQRPVCTACVRRGSSCTFGGRLHDSSDSSSSQTPLPGDANRHNDAIELLTLLTSIAPEEEALDLLNEIKSCGDFSLALAQIKKGRTLDHEDEGPDFLWPPNQGSVEFELMVRHPILYPSDAALDSRLDPSRLYIRRVPESGKSNLLSNEIDHTGLTDTTLREVSRVAQEKARRPHCWADAHLSAVDFAHWTNVTIDNGEAAKAVSKYLELDHVVLGLFDADLFLDDLCNKRTRFCSKFMVNALLSWALLDASLLKTSPADSSTLLFSEALSYRQSVQLQDSLPALAALQLLSLTATYLGQGDLGLQLLRQGISMGLRMKLMSHGVSLRIDEPVSERDKRAISHSAWGLFSFATSHALHFQQVELGTVPPPELPLPGDEPYASDAGPTTTTPAHVDNHFPYFCRLWKLVHDVICRYYTKENSPRSYRFSADYVRTMFGRFLSLGDQLPLSLVRGNNTTHHGIILHIFFHAGILTLLRPLVLYGDDTPLGLSTHTNKPAELISRASVNQLRRLVAIYILNFSSEFPTVLWHTGCLYLANAIIRSTPIDGARPTDFYLAISGYKSLYPRYPVSITIVKGLLSMAVSNDVMTSQEAGQVIRRFKAKGDGPYPIEEPTETSFMIDLDLALTDQGGAHIDNLARQFDDMVMFDEFITHDHVDDEDVAMPQL